MAGYSSNIEVNSQADEQASGSADAEQKKPLERVVNGLRKIVAATEGLATEPQAYYQECK
ncbi:MAG: hypothetical protein ACOC5M_00770 [Chloroflexota bacterium]